MVFPQNCIDYDVVVADMVIVMDTVTAIMEVAMAEVDMVIPVTVAAAVMEMATVVIDMVIADMAVAVMVIDMAMVPVIDMAIIICERWGKRKR